MDVAALIVATLVPLVFYHRSAWAFRVPRETFLAVSTWALLAAWMLTGPVLHAKWSIVGVALAFFAWSAAVSAIGPRPSERLHGLFIASCCAFLGLVVLPAVDEHWLIVALTTSAVIHCGVFAVQKARGCTGDLAAGAMGNTNKLGAYLVPHVFIAMAAGPGWMLAAGALLWAIVATKHRGALVGLGAGFAYLFVSGAGLLPVAVVAAALIIAMIRMNRSSESIKDRFFMWKVALVCIGKRLMVGYGYGGMKMAAADVARDSGLTEVAPKQHRDRGLAFRRAHNDVLQLVADAGFFGLVFMAHVVFGAFGFDESGSTVWPAALCSLLGVGLFVHALHFTPSCLLFWICIGQMARAEPMAVGAHPAVAAAVLFGSLALLFCLVLKNQWLCLLTHKFYRTGKQDMGLMREMLELAPESGRVLTDAAELAVRQSDYQLATVYAFRAAENHDGELVKGTLYGNLARCAAGAGDLALSEYALRRTLQYAPGNEPMRQSLTRVVQARVMGA